MNPWNINFGGAQNKKCTSVREKTYSNFHSAPMSRPCLSPDCCNGFASKSFNALPFHCPLVHLILHQLLRATEIHGTPGDVVFHNWDICLETMSETLIKLKSNEGRVIYHAWDNIIGWQANKECRWSVDCGVGKFQGCLLLKIPSKNLLLKIPSQTFLCFSCIRWHKSVLLFRCQIMTYPAGISMMGCLVGKFPPRLSET